jgi:hypothetical protein
VLLSQELVSRKLPKLARHLKGLNCDMSIIATDWFLCLFSTALPSEVQSLHHHHHPFLPCTPCHPTPADQDFVER